MRRECPDVEELLLNPIYGLFAQIVCLWHHALDWLSAPPLFPSSSGPGMAALPACINAACNRWTASSWKRRAGWRTYLQQCATYPSHGAAQSRGVMIEMIFMLSFLRKSVPRRRPGPRLRPTPSLHVISRHDFIRGAASAGALFAAHRQHRRLLPDARHRQESVEIRRP